MHCVPYIQITDCLRTDYKVNEATTCNVCKCYLRSGMSLPQSSAAGGIHGLLLKLHESLADDDTGRASLNCQDLVGDLGQTCILTPSDNELGKNHALSSKCVVGSLVLNATAFNGCSGSMLFIIPMECNSCIVLGLQKSLRLQRCVHCRLSVMQFTIVIRES